MTITVKRVRSVSMALVALGAIAISAPIAPIAPSQAAPVSPLDVLDMAFVEKVTTDLTKIGIDARRVPGIRDTAGQDDCDVLADQMKTVGLQRRRSRR